MLTDKEFEEAAKVIGCETAALKAIQAVETGGRGGFFDEEQTYPAILFEGHIFWQQLKKDGYDPNKFVKGNEDILYDKWTKTHYKGGMGEWERLEKAMKIHREAALKSASYGMFQLMGFNYEVCECESVNEFVEKMSESEAAQLMLAAKFINANKSLRSALIAKDWARVAKCYNGPAYAENKYDTKLAQAYAKFKK